MGAEVVVRRDSPVEFAFRRLLGEMLTCSAADSCCGNAEAAAGRLHLDPLMAGLRTLPSRLEFLIK